MSRIRLSITGVLAASIVLTGCSGDAPEQDQLDLGSLPASPAPGVRQEVRGIAQGGAAINNAVEELTRRCMLDLGLQFNKGPADTDEIAETTFGITVIEAQASGYGLDDTGTTEPEFIDPNQDLLAAMTPDEYSEWSKALLGNPDAGSVAADIPGVGQVSYPTDGCQAQARATLFGDQETAIEAVSVIDNLPIAAITRAQDDSRIIDLNRRWAECMVNAGVAEEPASPDEAFGMASDAIVNQGPVSGHSTERRLALQDAICEDETSYVETRVEIEDIYLTQMMSSYEGRIAAAAEARRAAATEANQVLSTP